MGNSLTGRSTAHSMGPANTVAGYQVYGALIDDATYGKNYVIGIDATVGSDPVIAANTFIYLNTDQNRTTGFTPFGSVGAEYYVQFATDPGGVLRPYLYSVTPAGVATQLNDGVPLDFGVSSNGDSVEIAVPQQLLMPSGGTPPTSINFAALINNGAVALPGDFDNVPQYTITDPSVPVDAPTTIGNVILDGQFTDWPLADAVEIPGNTVAGYEIYGALIDDATLGKNYVIGIEAAISTDPVIAASTFIYLNTDQSRTTGFTPFGSVGAEYYVQFATELGRRASALSLLGHARRRCHPAQRRGAAEFRRLQRWRQCRDRNPAGVIDAIGRYPAERDQFRCADQQRRSCASRRFRQQPSIHHHRSLGTGRGPDDDWQRDRSMGNSPIGRRPMRSRGQGTLSPTISSMVPSSTMRRPAKTM